MAEFVRAQVLGTTFEITSRLIQLPAEEHGTSESAVCGILTGVLDTLIFSLWEWGLMVWFG